MAKIYSKQVDVDSFATSLADGTTLENNNSKIAIKAGAFPLAHSVLELSRLQILVQIRLQTL
jgi:hypothetical protein